MTTGNRVARLPFGLGADRPGPVPRGNCDGRASGPVTPGSGAGAPLAGELPGAGGPERDGDGLGESDLLGDGEGWARGDLLGEGDGLGEGDLLGDGEGLGESDLLGDGEGLGEGDLLGDGEEEGDLVDWLGDGDGTPVTVAGSRARAGLAAAPVLPRTAMRIPAAAAPPPASTRALARALPGARPR